MRYQIRAAALAIGLMMLLSACGTGPTGGAATPGVTDKEILLGATTPFSGGIAAYGTVTRAANAYYQYVNDQGGVNGRKIKYIMVDDAFNPATTIELTRRLVEQDKVFAMVGSTGTGTQIAVRTYLNQNKVPQLFLTSGDASWGVQHKQFPYSMGWQATPYTEILVLLNLITKQISTPKIAYIAQDDDAGQSGLKVLQATLPSSVPIALQFYNPNAVTDIRGPLAKLASSESNAIVLSAAGKFTSQGLVDIYKSGWRPLVTVPGVAMSNAVVQQTVAAAGSQDAMNGVVATFYLKDPLDPAMANDAGIKLYKEIMAKYYPNGDVSDQFNVWGMGEAFSAVDALKNAGRNLTRDSFLSAAFHLNEPNNPFVLPGIEIKTTPDDTFPIAATYVKRYESGKWVPLGGAIDTRKQLEAVAAQLQT